MESPPTLRFQKKQDLHGVFFYIGNIRESLIQGDIGTIVVKQIINCPNFFMFACQAPVIHDFFYYIFLIF